MPPQQIASDIYLVAEQKPHPLYIRSGSDLILALELTLGTFDDKTDRGRNTYFS